MMMMACSHFYLDFVPMSMQLILLDNSEWMVYVYCFLVLCQHQQRYVDAMTRTAASINDADRSYGLRVDIAEEEHDH